MLPLDSSAKPPEKTNLLRKIYCKSDTGALKKLIFRLVTRNIATNEVVKKQKYFVYFKAFTTHSWGNRAVRLLKISFERRQYK